MVTSRQPTRRDFIGRTAKLAGTALAAGSVGPTAARAAEKRGKGVWQIGCYTRPWDKQDYRVALDAIAKAGFKYAGLMTTNGPGRLVISAQSTPEHAAEVAEELAKRRLEVASVYGGGFPLNRGLPAAAKGLRQLIDNCAIVKSKSLLMGGVRKKEQYDLYYQAIAECCDYAASKGMEITLKPHGGMNATGPQCRKSIEKVGHKNFHLWYDPGNIYYYSEGKLDPVDQAATVDGLVTGMCVKDFRPAEGERQKDVWVTPGTGKVDFQAVLARLKKGGFTGGPLIIETVERGDLAKTLEEVVKTRKFLEALTRKLG